MRHGDNHVTLFFFFFFFLPWAGCSSSFTPCHSPLYLRFIPIEYIRHTSIRYRFTLCTAQLTCCGYIECHSIGERVRAGPLSLGHPQHCLLSLSLASITKLFNSFPGPASSFSTSLMSDQTSSVRYLPDPPSPRSPFDNTLQLRKDPWPTPHLPNSPPASHDSPDPNPATFQPALTPPASVSMSAQPSHSSVLSASHSPTMPEDGLDNVTSPPHSNVESRSILSQSKSVVSPMKRQSSDDGGGNPPKRPRLEHSDIPSSHTESFEINQNAVDSAAQSSEAPLPTVGISEPDSRSGPGVVSYYKLGSGRKFNRQIGLKIQQ